MQKTKLSVLFKKIQKDDKKEVLEFHVQGDELPNSQELVSMAGSIAIIEVEGSEAGNITAEFKSIQRDSKKTALKFNVKGDSEDKVIKLYPFAGRGVTLNIEPSQLSIDEFYDGDHDGIEYEVQNDGTVEVHQDQMNMEDVEEDNDDPDQIGDDVPLNDEDQLD